MKSCPTCNRTYPDDTLAFCLMDGSVLSAPYDPEAAQPNASAGESGPRTEVLNPEPQSQPLPETRAAVSPTPLQPTITAPPPVIPQVQARERSQPRGAASGRSGIGARVLVTAILIGVAILGFFLVWSLSRKTANSNKVDINITTPSK